MSDRQFVRESGEAYDALKAELEQSTKFLKRAGEESMVKQVEINKLRSKLALAKEYTEAAIKIIREFEILRDAKQYIAVARIETVLQNCLKRLEEKE